MTNETKTPRANKSYKGLAVRVAKEFCTYTKQADSTEERLATLIEAALEESGTVGSSYYELLYKNYERLECELAALRDQLDALRRDKERLIDVAKRFLDETDAPPPNCSCHISPPCNDCVEWGGMRELRADAQSLLDAARKERHA